MSFYGNTYMEAPLTSSQRLRLAVYAAVYSASFYLLCTVAAAVVFLLVLMYVLSIGLTPVILVLLVNSWISLVSLIGTTVRGMFVRSAEPPSIALARLQSLSLHESVSGTAKKLGIKPPSRIFINLSTGLYVKPVGWMFGGYNLVLGCHALAASTPEEFDAALTHALGHVKYDSLGYKRWLNNSAGRITEFSKKLDQLVKASESKKKRFYTAEIILRCIDRLGPNLCGAIAAYFRQDVFSADTLAAKICGTAACASVLKSEYIASRILSGYSLRDLIIQMQRKDSVSGWLKKILNPSEDERARLEFAVLQADKPNFFNTYPSLKSRLTALGYDDQPLDRTRSAIDLLDSPDEVVSELISWVEHDFVAKSNKAVGKRRVSRGRKARSRKATPSQVLLMIPIIALTMVMMFVAGDRVQSVDMAFIAMYATFGIGASVCYISCRTLQPKERLTLPVPSISALEESFMEARGDSSPGSWGEQLIQELRPAYPMGISKTARARYWADLSYKYLESGDYRRVWAASKLCLEAEPDNLEGLLAHGVSAAYFGGLEESNRSSLNARKKYCEEGSVAWGTAWAAMLIGDWKFALPFIELASASWSDNAVMTAMLGLCQLQCQMLPQALDTMRRAVSMDPDEPRYRSLVARILLDEGKPADASEYIPDDPNTADDLINSVRARVMFGDTDEALKLVPKAQTIEFSATDLITLGYVLSDAEIYDQAYDCYMQATEQGYYPTALVSMGRAAFLQGDSIKAREHLFSALDVTRELGKGAVRTMNMLPTIIDGLHATGNAEDGCSSWEADIDMTGSPLEISKMNLLMYARNESNARDLAREFYLAMHPGRELQDSSLISRFSDQEAQPKGPVVPGVYGFKCE